MLYGVVMRQRWRGAAGGVAAVALDACVAARPAAADEIQLNLDAGRVTLIATGAPLTAVLAAWSRVGGTRFVDAEAVAGTSVTLHLVDVAEPAALRVLLRPVVGYVAAPRRAGSTGASRYGRVKILGTGRLAPASGAAGGARPAGDAPAGVGTPAATPRAAGSGPSGADAAGTVRPAPTTPFPGMVVEPDEP